MFDNRVNYMRYSSWRGFNKKEIESILSRIYMTTSDFMGLMIEAFKDDFDRICSEVGDKNCREEFVKWYIGQVLTDDLVNNINARMWYVPVISEPSSKQFYGIIENMADFVADDAVHLPDVLPAVGNKRAFRVGYDDGYSGVVSDYSFETEYCYYLLEDGNFINTVEYCYMILDENKESEDRDGYIIRNMIGYERIIPNILEGFFPEGYRFLKNWADRKEDAV